MTIEIGMLLFPNVTQLDLTGPFEVLRSLPNARVHTLGKTTEPVQSEGGLTLVPSTSYADAPKLDVLFVPGGAGQIPMTRDPEVLAYLHEVGSAARWVSSACTGALLLGAAGLLRGYRAATHWAFMELLPIVGAIPVEQRVVVDRNRITGGGVTAGIHRAHAGRGDRGTRDRGADPAPARVRPAPAVYVRPSSRRGEQPRRARSRDRESALRRAQSAARSDRADLESGPLTLGLLGHERPERLRRSRRRVPRRRRLVPPAAMLEAGTAPRGGGVLRDATGDGGEAGELDGLHDQT